MASTAADDAEGQLAAKIGDLLPAHMVLRLEQLFSRLALPGKLRAVAGRPDRLHQPLGAGRPGSKSIVAEPVIRLTLAELTPASLLQRALHPGAAGSAGHSGNRNGGRVSHRSLFTPLQLRRTSSSPIRSRRIPVPSPRSLQSSYRLLGSGAVRRRGGRGVSRVGDQCVRSRLDRFCSS